MTREPVDLFDDEKHALEMSGLNEPPLQEVVVFMEDVRYRTEIGW